MKSLAAFVRERTPALRSADFRRLWIAQIISAAGSQMQFAAINWQIYERTHNAAALGGVGLVRVLPILLFSLAGGAFADTVDRRRLMLITQSIMALVATVLGALTLRGMESLITIYLLTSLGAAAVAFDNPARQSLFPTLVPREDLANAAALNSTGFQVATITGPVLAGLTIRHFGPGFAYLLNAVSFLAVIGALIAIRTSTAVKASGAADAPRQRITWETLHEALRFMRATPILGITMLLDCVATFFSSASALLPIYAKDILHVGPEGFGLLAAFPAVGSLIAGIILSVIPLPTRTGRVLLTAVTLYGLATIGFGFSTTFVLAGLCLAGTGAADTVSTVLRQTIRNLVTPDRLRGRIISASMIFFMGGPQLGELEAGVVARYWGAPFSVISGGIGCVLAIGLVASRAPFLWNYRLSEHLAVEPVVETAETATSA